MDKIPGLKIPGSWALNYPGIKKSRDLDLQKIPGVKDWTNPGIVTIVHCIDKKSLYTLLHRIRDSRKCYFVSKIVLTYCEKKEIYLVIGKTFFFWGWRPTICKIFKINRTINCNSEKPVQFMNKNAFYFVPGGFSELIH